MVSSTHTHTSTYKASKICPILVAWHKACERLNFCKPVCVCVAPYPPPYYLPFRLSFILGVTPYPVPMRNKGEGVRCKGWGLKDKPRDKKSATTFRNT